MSDLNFSLLKTKTGMLMTPPASPPLTSHPASVSRSISHSSVVSSASVHHPHHHHSSSSQQQLISNVPSSTAAALNRIAQAAHSWRPEEARRLAEQAWQDSLLSPAGLLPQPKPSLQSTTDPAASALVSSSPANNTSTTDKDSTVNLWDFIDPTTKNSCICVK